MGTGLAVLLSVHLAATGAMVGLIWFVQVVHYPLFAVVHPDRFVDYELGHTRRTGWVVGPLMGVEVVAAVAAVAASNDELPLVWTLLGLGLLAVIHTSTVVLQVPRHRELAAGFDADSARRLVTSNWIRTVGWSARGVVAVAMIVVAA